MITNQRVLSPIIFLGIAYLAITQLHLGFGAVRLCLIALILCEAFCDIGQLFVQLQLFGLTELVLRIAGPYRKAWLLLPGKYPAVVYASWANQLSFALCERQNFMEALALNRANVTLLEQRAGKNSLEVAGELICQAYILGYNGTAADGEWAAERALNILNSTVNNTVHNRSYLALALNNLAGVYVQSGQREKALELYHQSLQIKQSLCASNSQELAVAYANVGYALLKSDCCVEAESFCRSAVEIVLSRPTPALNKATFMNNLGEVLRRQRNLVEAEKYLTEALKLRELSLSKRHPHLGYSYQNMAKLMFDRQELAESERYFLKAMEIRTACPGIEHSDLNETLVEYARLLNCIGRDHEAQALLEVHRIEEPFRLGADSVAA